MTDQTCTQLHLGLGAFHRAHQAVYLQDLRDTGDHDWQLIAGNIRLGMEDTISALIAQGGSYTLETVDSSGNRAYQLIEAIRQVIPYEPGLAALVDVAANPNTRIISFTVTEAGYYLDGYGNLDPSFEDLQSDLAGKSCSTLYGALALLLEARRLANAGAVTLLNCDNLRSNGARFYNGFQQFLQQVGKLELLEWVLKNTTAPNAMVDRITPRPTSDIVERVKSATGRQDPAALMGETFIQWVIEDDFIAGRPAWENVGVELVEDVLPYEEAKIRLLNATHTCIAWAGALRGYNYIHESCADADIMKFAYDYVSDDTIPCLDSPENPCPIDLEKYRDVVLDRFSNPYIQDTVQRVSMDAYSKIPSQIVPTIRECLHAGRSLDSVAMLPALFLAFLKKQQEGELLFEYFDQAMTEESTTRIFAQNDHVAAFVNESLLFDDIAGNEQLLVAMNKAYQRVHAFMRQ